MGDRRAFMAWSKRLAALSARLQQAIVRAATAEHPA